MLLLLDDARRIPRLVPAALWTGGLLPLRAQAGAVGALDRTPPAMLVLQRQGAFCRTVFDDFYGRIHYSAVDFDLGALVGETTRTLVVFNATFQTQQLQAILKQDVEGIDLSPDAPLEFAALQSRTFRLDIHVDGSPVVDGRYTFDWAAWRDTVVTVRGLRIVAWPVPPHWDTGIRERFEFKTEVQDGGRSATYKRALRLSPRRSFEFEVKAAGRERRVLDAVLADWSARTWALPIWHDVFRLRTPLAMGATVIAADTSGRDFVAGGLVMLYRNVRQYEVAEVLTVEPQQLVLKRPLQSDWPLPTRLYPCRTARVGAAGSGRLWNDETGLYTLNFDLAEASDWPATWPRSQYRGAPVLEWRPVEQEDPTVTHERAIDTIDVETGLPELLDRLGVNLRASGFQWWLGGRVLAAKFRSLLYAFNGRLNEAWLPSFTADLKLLSDLGGGALDVEWCAYTRHQRGRIDRQDVRIELIDGAVHYRRIGDAIELDGDRERLVLDSPFVDPIPKERVRQVSFMALSELASDTIEWTHTVDDDGVNTVGLALRGVKHAR